MSDARYIDAAGLDALAARLVAQGTRVVAPVAVEGGAVEYRVLRPGDAPAWGGPVMPRRSLKEFFLPPTERLFSYRRDGHDVTLEAAPDAFAPTVILGARPCDAAALPIVDRVMNWDYHDGPWFGRRVATTVVVIGCDGGDRSCFCGVTGTGPGQVRGADVFLAPAGDGYVVTAAGAQGEAFLAEAGELPRATPAMLESAEGVADEASRRVAAHLDVDLGAIARWLDGGFGNTFWDGLALRCHGCGACAAVCPTCHCFDIVDEPEGIDHGARRRNWDTCQAAKFTLHASGHNPRATQDARIRQRVTHKFSIYPARFDAILCTGCGRCARQCPGGMDLPEILSRIAARAAGGAAE